MFRIVENTDGSTTVFYSDTGEYLCSVPKRTHKPLGIGRPIPRTVETPPKSFSAVPRNTKTCLVSPYGYASGLTCDVKPVIKKLDDDDIEREIAPYFSDSEREIAPYFSDSESLDYSEDCVSQDQFLQTLNIINIEKYSENDLPKLRAEFPLRKISRVKQNRTFVASPETKVLDDTEICSPLGQKILSTTAYSKHNFDESTSVMSIKKYDNYCRNDNHASECNIPKLRCREIKDYSLTYRPQKSWGTGCHMYSFNRQQRIERLKVIKTGLSKEGRALKRLCKDVSVHLKRLTKAEIAEHTKPDINPSRQNLKSSIGWPAVYNKSIDDDDDDVIIISPLSDTGKVKNQFLERVKAEPIVLLTRNILPRSKSSSRSGASQLSGHSVPLSSRLFQSQKNYSRPSRNANLKIGLRNSSFLKSSNASFKKWSLKQGNKMVKHCKVVLDDVMKRIVKLSRTYYVIGTHIKVHGIKRIKAKPQSSRSVPSVCSSTQANSQFSLRQDHAYYCTTPENVNSKKLKSSALSVKVQNHNTPPDSKVLTATIKSRMPILSITPGVPSTYVAPNGNVSGTLISPVTSKTLVKGPTLQLLKIPNKSNTVSLPFAPHRTLFLTKNPQLLLRRSVPAPSFGLPSSSVARIAQVDVPVIDITDDDYANVSNVAVNNISSFAGSDMKSWTFHCFGCNLKRMFSNKNESDKFVKIHMINYHSVSQPDKFLEFHIDMSKKTVSIEAFPGYKTGL